MGWFNRGGGSTPAPAAPFDFPWKRSVPTTLALVVLAFFAFIVFEIGFSIVWDGGLALLMNGSPTVKAFVGAHKDIFKEVSSEVGYIFTFTCQILMFRFFTQTKVPTAQLVGATFDKLKGQWTKLLVIGVLGFLAVHVLDAALYLLTPGLPEPKSPAVDFANTLHGTAFVMATIAAPTMAPIFEEIFCRGFIFNALRASFRNGWVGRHNLTVADYTAIIISAVFFAAIHGTLSGFPGLFFAGFVLAWVYRRTGSLWAPMAVHFVMNAVPSIFMLLAAGSA